MELSVLTLDYRLQTGCKKTLALFGQPTSESGSCDEMQWQSWTGGSHRQSRRKCHHRRHTHKFLAPITLAVVEALLRCRASHVSRDVAGNGATEKQHLRIFVPRSVMGVEISAFSCVLSNKVTATNVSVIPEAALDIVEPVYWMKQRDNEPP